MQSQQHREKPKRISKNELKQLSRNALRVFAARDALRILPLASGAGSFNFWGNDAARHMASVECACLAALPSVRYRKADAARTAAAAADVAADVADATRTADADAARTAAAAAAAAAADDVTAYAVYNGVYAYATYAIYADNRTAAYAAARFDFQNLLENITPESLLSKPLWWDGMPKSWPSILENWQRALVSVGLEDIYHRYQGFLNGEPDMEAAEQAVEDWYNHYGANNPESVFLNKNSLHEKAEQIMKKVNKRTKKNMEETAEAPVEIYLGGPVTATQDGPTIEDHLGRTALVDALHGLLDHPDQQGRLTIGLMGYWGAGKSSVIKMIKKSLAEKSRHPFICAEFDAWTYEHCGNIQAGMAQELVKHLTSDLGGIGKLWLAAKISWKQHPWRLAWTVLGLVGVVVSVYNLGSQTWLAGFSSLAFLALMLSQAKQIFAHPMAAQLRTYLRLPDFGEYFGKLPVIQQQVKDLCEMRLMGKEKRRLLFVADNLDRCGVDGLVKVLEATHIVMDLPQVVVLIAVDHRMALAALTQHYSKLAEKGSHRSAQAIARDYLGKIFQLSIQLDGSAKLMNEYIENHLFPNAEDFVGQIHPDAQEDLPQGLAGSPSDINPTEPLITGNHNNTKNKQQNRQVEADSPPPHSSKTESSSLPPLVKNGGEAEQLAMKDTREEMAWFRGLTEITNFHNPRQLKRLHNTHRLMKGIVWHRKGRPAVSQGLLEQWMQSMAMLFWLEYLYGLDVKRRKHQEAAFISGKLDGFERLHERMPLEGSVFSMSLYNQLKQEVTPFMLPCAETDH